MMATTTSSSISVKPILGARASRPLSVRMRAGRPHSQVLATTSSSINVKADRRERDMARASV